VRIVFMGTPQFAVPTLKALVDAEEDILAVVSQPDRPAGRGQKVVPPPVKQYALGEGITVLQPLKMKDPAFLSHFEGLKPDLTVVVAFGRILPPEILKVPKLGCVNVHASLLPKYRGAAPIQWAVINGETETGVTTMQMDEGMDTGPILLQERTTIEPTETAGQLADRISIMGTRLLIRTLEMLRKGELKPKPQDPALATYAPLLKKEDGKIRWELKAKQIYNLIRGTDPWPGAYTFYKDQHWRIFKARVVDEEGTSGQAGQIVKVEKREALVSTGRGILALLQLQAPNSRRMTFQEYLAGHPVEEGVILL
jgi:methionyl-tRNA formyltransferase